MQVTVAIDEDAKTAIIFIGDKKVVLNNYNRTTLNNGVVYYGQAQKVESDIIVGS